MCVFKHIWIVGSWGSILDREFCFAVLDLGDKLGLQARESPTDPLGWDGIVGLFWLV
jgi:hypothetical protein